MILIVDNTENLKEAYMTPIIIDYFKQQNINTDIMDSSIKLNYNNHFNKEYSGIILSGGPMLLSKDCNDIVLDNNVAIIHHYKKKIPILGICLGCQIISFLYGGSIFISNKENKGKYKINKTSSDSILLNDFPNTFEVYLEHKDFIKLNNKTFNITSKFNNIIMSIENNKEKIYGTQFHPEGLESTKKVIDNFIKICKIST